MYNFDNETDKFTDRTLKIAIEGIKEINIKSTHEGPGCQKVI